MSNLHNYVNRVFKVYRKAIEANKVPSLLGDDSYLS